jgi:hypothetical protein
MKLLTVCSVINDFKCKKKLTELVKVSRFDSYRLTRRISHKYTPAVKVKVKEVRDN